MNIRLMLDEIHDKGWSDLAIANQICELGVPVDQSQICRYRNGVYAAPKYKLGVAIWELHQSLRVLGRQYREGSNKSQAEAPPSPAQSVSGSHKGVK